MNDVREDMERAVQAAPDRPGVYQRVAVSMAPADPLAWLTAQPWDDKGFWADRDDAVEVAAAGEADTIKGAAQDSRAKLFKVVEARLQSATEDVRYYGGFRFAPGTATDMAWRPFGAFRFLLPRFEMTRRGESVSLACIFRTEERDRAVADVRRLAMPAPAPPCRLPKQLTRRNQPDLELWRTNVAAVLDAVREKRVDKVVLARRTAMDFLGVVDPLAVMARLRNEMPGCFHFCGSHSGLVAFAGASPERLYRREGRMLDTEALAGTRARGKTNAEDQRLATELRNSEKEMHEHRLVVESIRESLEPLVESMDIEKAPDVLELANVQHLRTRMRAKLRSGTTDEEILRNLHPTPAVGGRPRAESMALIDKLESFDRGWYTGPVGWVGRDAAEFAVAIRCGLVLGPRLCLYSGAGIVKGSTPDDEWRELDEKLSSFLSLFGKT